MENRFFFRLIRPAFRQKKAEPAGFTLLEIMLAILILAMVVSMVTLSLSGSLRVIDATMEQGEVYYRAQVAMERISEDLTSAVLPENIEFIGRKDEDGNGTLLSFASMAHVVFDQETGQEGMGLISYGVQPDRDDEQQLLLLRSDVLYRPAGDQQADADAEAFLLCDRLRSLKFSFINRKGGEQEEWDSTVEEGDKDKERALPAAVVCTLEFWISREEESSIIFQTTVVLPVGLIQAAKEEKAGAS